MIKETILSPQWTHHRYSKSIHIPELRPEDLKELILGAFSRNHRKIVKRRVFRRLPVEEMEREKLQIGNFLQASSLTSPNRSPAPMDFNFRLFKDPLRNICKTRALKIRVPKPKHRKVKHKIRGTNVLFKRYPIQFNEVACGNSESSLNQV